MQNAKPKSESGKSLTLGRVMLRPKWILALILALAVGAGFAALAQWQMGSAVKLEASKVDSETVYELHELTATQMPVTDETAGRMVSFEGQLLDGDRFIVANRLNHGDLGFWVVGHARSIDGSEHLAVALGWSPDEASAEKALLTQSANSVQTFVGRYQPQESVNLPNPKESTSVLKSISPAELVNLWEPYEGQVFAGYMVIADQLAGLEKIESIAPLPQEKINWLNLFYAIEWMVFGGFAVFFWYRLARDAWEKELELQAISKASEE